MSDSKNIETQMVFKATAELQRQIAEELSLETPDMEKAKAIINENSTRNDTGNSSEDDRQSSEEAVS